MEDSVGLILRQVIVVIQNRIMSETTYFGISTLKSRIDFWVYQEILYESKPDVIVESGNGGGTLALAHLCDSIGHGKAIGPARWGDSLPSGIDSGYADCSAQALALCDVAAREFEAG